MSKQNQRGNFYTNFNRNDFYKIKINNLEKYENYNFKVDMNSDFSDYNYIKGIWAIYSGNVCLDVCETSNMGFEMRKWELMYWENKDKTNKELKRLNKLNTYNRKKKRDISLKYKNIQFIFVCEEEDKLKREIIETQYAHKYRARYWSPAPGNQVRLVYNTLNSDNITYRKNKIFIFINIISIIFIIIILLLWKR